MGRATLHPARAVALWRGLVKDGPDPVGDALDLSEALKEQASLDVAMTVRETMQLQGRMFAIPRAESAARTASAELDRYSRRATPSDLDGWPGRA